MKIKFINSENINSLIQELEILQWNITNQTEQPYSHYWNLDLNSKTVVQVEPESTGEEYQTYELFKDVVNTILLFNE